MKEFSMSKKFLIIVPTYNESENISRLLNGIGELRKEGVLFNVLVVDDASPDGTATIVNNLKFPWVSVLNRRSKSGLGAAYVDAFKYGIKNDYEFLIEIDADGSHQFSDLKKILLAPEDLDLVIGSRWILNGTIENWPKYRQFISRFGNWYARQLLGFHIKDSTSGLRRIKASTLKKINLDEISTQGYGFQIELAYKISRLDSKVVEIPINFIEREFGKSKMSPTIAMEALFNVFKLSLHKDFNNIQNTKGT